MNRIPTEFRSNRHLVTKRARTADPLRPVSTSPTLEHPDRTGHARIEDEPQDRTQGEPMGGLMAFQAFGIATALVLGSAGLGAWGVAKFLGVNDVRLSISLISRQMTDVDPKLDGRVLVQDEGEDGDWDAGADNGYAQVRSGAR